MGKDNKNSFFKRFLITFTSVFLALGIHAHQIKSLSENNSQLNRKTESNELNDFLENYRNEYIDFAQTGKGIITLDDILFTNIEHQICDTMVPQGLVITDKYLFVSAYCGIDGYKNELRFNSFSKKFFELLKGEYNHKQHNSVIYVYDIKSKKFIMTLELPDKNHVGGLAFDGENLYIAKSSDNQVSRITYKKINELVQENEFNGKKSNKIEYDDTINVDCEASFLTVRNIGEEKELWIGTFSQFTKDSSMICYNILEDGNLEFKQIMRVEVFSQRSRFYRI